MKPDVIRFLYFIAVLLILFWALGFLIFGLGQLIHILLILAVISILRRLIRGREVLPGYKHNRLD
ncbi:MAG: lmo0937 family membrane protein [Bacteroidales bacterium]|nr:lmo0937 family membrane protein [Bacteroidales bacterium]